MTPYTRQTTPARRGERAALADKSFFARGIIAAGLALCALSVPLACSLGSLDLPFADVVRALSALLTKTPLTHGATATNPEGLPLVLDRETLLLVVRDLRLPRVLLALCAGAGLAVAGAVFQGILRNPLADPFTLGVSGGAAFGASLSISFGFTAAAFGFGLPLAAFAGAAFALALVLALGSMGGGGGHERLILAGVVVSALLAALISLVKALDESSVTGIVFWIMGSFQGRGRSELLLLLPGLISGCAIAFALSNPLDMLSLGDSTARHLGLNAPRLRLILLLAAGAITASCVAVSGIIGFIGLIVPHLCRLLLGAAHARLLPASALCGALLLLWSDVAARGILPGGVELPVGVVTALLGGPFFCFILSKTTPTRHTGTSGAAKGLPLTIRSENICAPFPILPVTAKEKPPPVFCRDLSFGYGKKNRRPSNGSERAEFSDEDAVLNHISFSLQPGEFTALLGPNGSGKSTLLHCLSGTLTPWSGVIRIHGKDNAGLSEKRRARLLAHLPQKPESIPGLSVLQLTLMGRYAHTSFGRGYSPEDRKKTLRALAQTGAEHLARRPANTLSGGELQRVLLARALTQETPLLFLDEATAGLDPAFQIAMLDILRQKNRETGLSILAAMHDINLAALYCGRLIFLKQGRIVADGAVAETFTAQTLSAVYESRVTVIRHPVNGQPQALLDPLQ